jgi:Tfp pilus assembly protein PilV
MFVQASLARRGSKLQRQQWGLSLVEVLFAVALLGALAIVASSLITPLRVTRNASLQTTGLTIARSYMEATKKLWVNPNKFNVVWPADADVGVPSGWTVQRTSAPPISSTNAPIISFNTASVVTIEARPPSYPTEPGVSITALITQTPE